MGVEWISVIRLRGPAGVVGWRPGLAPDLGKELPQANPRESDVSARVEIQAGDGRGAPRSLWRAPRSLGRATWAVRAAVDAESSRTRGRRIYALASAWGVCVAGETGTYVSGGLAWAVERVRGLQIDRRSGSHCLVRLFSPRTSGAVIVVLWYREAGVPYFVGPGA